MFKHTPSKEWFERQAEFEDSFIGHSREPEEISLEPGANVSVFDSQLWDKNGGDSKTDNFMRSATILRVYLKGRDILVDVKFQHNGRVSKGHFANGVASA